jgi:hypothetical protein
LGYSEDFVKNLEKIFKQIKSDPEVAIEIIDRPDDICSHCPHQKDQACQKDGSASEGQVQEKDNLIIKRLGIKKNKTFFARDIFNLVSQGIFPEDLAQLCNGCEWLKYGYCAEGLRQKRLRIKL